MDKKYLHHVDKQGDKILQFSQALCCSHGKDINQPKELHTMYVYLSSALRKKVIKKRVGMISG